MSGELSDAQLAQNDRSSWQRQIGHYVWRTAMSGEQSRLESKNATSDSHIWNSYVWSSYVWRITSLTNSHIRRIIVYRVITSLSLTCFAFFLLRLIYLITMDLNAVLLLTQP